MPLDARILPQTKDGFNRVSIGIFDLDDFVGALDLKNMAKEVGVEGAWLLTAPNEYYKESKSSSDQTDE